MYRVDKADITVNNNTLVYKTFGTVLGIKINRRRSNGKQQATSSLTRLFRLKNLPERNKLKL